MDDVKVCFKCLRELPIECFYKHPMMSDGRLSKCAECTRRDVRLNRLKRVDAVREYDRKRNALPHRAALSTVKSKRERELHPKRNAARLAARRAAHKGKIVKPICCEVCGREDAKMELHHVDYSQPLLVLLLCKPCHAVADAIRRRVEKAQAIQS